MPTFIYVPGWRGGTRRRKVLAAVRTRFAYPRLKRWSALPFSSPKTQNRIPVLMQHRNTRSSQKWQFANRQPRGSTAHLPTALGAESDIRGPFRFVFSLHLHSRHTSAPAKCLDLNGIAQTIVPHEAAKDGVANL